MSVTEIVVGAIIGVGTGLIAGYISGLHVTKIFSDREKNRMTRKNLSLLYFYIDFIHQLFRHGEYTRIHQLLYINPEIEVVFMELSSLKPNEQVRKIFARCMLLKKELLNAILDSSIANNRTERDKQIDQLCIDINIARETIPYK